MNMITIDRSVVQQALAFTMRDFASLRDFEAAKAVLHDNLRDALAQQAEPVQDQRCRAEPRSDGDFVCDCKIGACPGRSAEPAQGPVAWRFKPMIGSPWSLSDDGYYISCKRDKGYIVEPLYTAPPQRQPLAEWQINDLMAGIDPEDVCSWSFRQGVYAAEKHHGVKP